MERCQFCGNNKRNKLSKSCHERYCASNPNRVEHPRHNLGKPGRNQFSRLRNPEKEVSDKTREKLALARRGQCIPPETRKKISEAMKKFFDENPDRVYYRANHYSNGPSYAEKYWLEVLTNAGLHFQAEMRFGRFWLDFAFPDARIDLEIDGAQHYSSEKAILRDAVRDAYVRGRGWDVIRVNWSQFKSLKDEDKTQFIASVLNQIRASSSIG